MTRMATDGTQGVTVSNSRATAAQTLITKEATSINLNSLLEAVGWSIRNSYQNKNESQAHIDHGPRLHLSYERFICGSSLKLTDRGYTCKRMVIGWNRDGDWGWMIDKANLRLKFWALQNQCQKFKEWDGWPLCHKFAYGCHMVVEGQECFV